MRLRPLYLASAFSLLFAFNLAYGQDALGPQPKKARTPADYKPRTLKAIAAAGRAIVKVQDADATDFVYGDLLPSRVKLVFKGAVRPLTPSRRQVISQWAQRYAGSPDYYTMPYTTEVLFAERGVSHWLVVKSSVVPDMSASLKRGSPVDLYLIRLGAFKEKGAWKWVLLVEDFGTEK